MSEASSSGASEIFEAAEETDHSSRDESSKSLSLEEASRSLWMLGKVDGGLRYAYLSISVPNRNLTDVTVIPTFRYVVRVNVSGNRLSSEALNVLQSMTYLLMLQADDNRVSSARMAPWRFLQVLCLSRNEITETTGLQHGLLECLELNYNRISALSLNHDALESLKVLELRGNRLSTTDGIFLPNLVSLYLAENRIRKIEGLESLVSLEVLHLRSNALERLDGFASRNARLSYVNVRANELRRISELGKLQCLGNLESLVASQNYFGGRAAAEEEEEEEDRGYRVSILIMLPNLKRIDKDPVLEEERAEAAESRARMLEDGLSFSHLDAEPEDY